MRLAQRLRRFARELLLNAYVNRAVFKLRFLWFVRVRRRVRMFENDRAVIANDYSRRMLLAGRTSDRPLRLIRPLAAIDAARRDSEVLSVGCRFETELLYLVGHGFEPARIRGLDMISYSPWIDVGNMHAMPYAEGQFDVVLLGWVLPYSADPAAAAREVLRVARDGAVIAVAMTYYPAAALAARRARGELIGEAEGRLQTTADVLALFGPAVTDVYFRHDAPDRDAEGVCAVVFATRKGRG